MVSKNTGHHIEDADSQTGQYYVTLPAIVDGLRRSGFRQVAPSILFMIPQGIMLTAIFLAIGRAVYSLYYLSLSFNLVLRFNTVTL